MMDSGTCRIYTVTDAASNGEMPNPALHEYGDYEWSFEERMISYSRQYAAMKSTSKSTESSVSGALRSVLVMWQLSQTGTRQGRNIESITYSRPLMTMGLRSQT